ncbi:MAG: hypothetical protein AAB486_02635 [Patescibacteria group bacterium]
MFQPGEEVLSWDYLIGYAVSDGCMWRKSLKTMQDRLALCGRVSTVSVLTSPVLIGGIYLLFWPVPLAKELTAHYLIILVALILYLAVIAGCRLLIERRLRQKIARHREKTMALWVVQFGSVPGNVLLLWQFYSQTELGWNFVPFEGAYGWLSRYIGDGHILLANGEREALSVMAFLKEWKDSPGALKMAAALDEEIASVTEECRQTLYWTEFWQRFKEQGQ